MAKKFKVEIKETMSKVISVKAESKEEALEKVRRMYDECGVILTAEDYESTQMEVIE